MQLHKGQEDFLYFKTNFDEEEFRVLRVTSSAKATQSPASVLQRQAAHFSGQKERPPDRLYTWTFPANSHRHPLWVTSCLSLT